MGFRRCNDALLPLDAAFTPQLPVSTMRQVAYVKALLSFGGLALCGAAANRMPRFLISISYGMRCLGRETGRGVFPR